MRRSAKLLQPAVTARLWRAIGVLFIAPIWVLAGETRGPVTDDLGVVMIGRGESITIGGYWTLSGPDVDLGIDQKRGVELALAAWDHEMAGHPITLVAVDGRCTGEGGTEAATKLAAMQDLVAVLGPDCSSSAMPAAPILWQAGLVSIGTSTTAPALTAPDRSAGFHGFLRTISSDLAQGAADARYFRQTLGCDTLATIHDDSPYSEQLVQVAETEFQQLGGTVVGRVGVLRDQVEMAPVLAALGPHQPCVIYFPMFVTASAALVREIPHTAGLEQTIPVAGPVLSPGFYAAAGEAAVGLQITTMDVLPSALGKDYAELYRRHVETYGEKPRQNYHAYAYDAAQILLLAIETVAVEEEGNTYIGRRALRDALFATEGHQGMSGLIDCNEHGDCGQFAFAVYQVIDADPDSYDLGTNPKRIFP